MLIEEAFEILSKANDRIAQLGSDYVDQAGTPKQPRTLQELIRVRQLYNLLNKFILINNGGTAINGTFGQNDAALNRLLLVLKKKAKIYTSPAIPNPIHSFVTESCCGSSLPKSGNNGDLLMWLDGDWINFAKGSDGQSLVSTPTGLAWSNAVGNGIPSGGSAGQYLKKNSNTSYDVVWGTIQTIDINGVTASPSEINILDGAIITTAELNYLSGLSGPLTTLLAGKISTALANGSFLVGNASNVATAVTPTGDVVFNNTGVFAISSGVIVDADVNASAAISRSKIAAGTSNRIVINSSTGVLNDAAAITANRLLVSDANGIPMASAVASSVVPFLDPSSSIQTQLNGKLSATISSPAQGDILVYNGTTYINYAVGTNGQVLMSNGTTVVWGSATANGLPTGGTTHQYLRKSSNSDYVTEWETLILADISDISTTFTEINLLSGLTATSAQLNYTVGVTAPIQGQIDNKMGRSLSYNALWVGNAGNIASELAPGIDGYVLTMVGTAPQWQPQTPPGNVSGVGPTTDNAIVRWNGISASSIQNSGIIIDDSNNIDGVANLRIETGGAIRTDVANTSSVLLQAYDVDGAAYTTFGTLTAGNVPTFNLADAVTINSAYIYRAGGTDVSLADGGTGVSLSDPGANKILAWDDTDNSIGFWTLGSGLSYDHSTHTLSATGTGSVGGPGSSTDNAIARWDGTTGTVIQNSGVIIDDSNNVTGIANITLTTGSAVRTGTSNTNTVLLQAYNTGSTSYTTFGTLTAGATPTFDLGTTTTIGTAYIYRIGGTDVSLADGGTGASLSAPGSDRIMFYDVSATSTAYLATGTTLTIIGTTIDVAAHGIANSNFRQSSALSIVGNATNATADVADISSSSDGDVLRRSGTTLGFGTITGSSITLSNGNATTWNGTTKTIDWGGTTSSNVSVTGNYSISLTDTTTDSGRNPTASLSLTKTTGSGTADANILLSASFTTLAGEGFSENVTTAKTLDFNGGINLTYTQTGTIAGNSYTTYATIEPGAIGLISTSNRTTNSDIALTIVTGEGLSFGKSDGSTAATGSYSFASGVNVSAVGRTGFASGLGNDSTRQVTSSGIAAIAMYATTSAQTSGHGALANYSAIIGGVDHNIPSTALRSVVLGGSLIKVSASVTDTAHAQNLRIGSNSYFGSFSTTPSAKIHISSGSTTAGTAPIKFTLGGSLMTTPENGAMEAVNSHIYWTDSTGVRWQLDQQFTNPMTTIGDIIQATTSGAPARLASVATGNVLLSGGVATANFWGKVNLTTHVSSILPVANGGTGTATPGLVAGANVTITGTWPNQTIASTGGGGGSSTLTINTQTSSYTLVLTDGTDTLVEMNSSTGNNVTVPPNSSVAFPIGTQIPVSQLGTGLTSIVAGAGVTIYTSAGSLAGAGQYTVMVLIKRGTNEWYLENGVAAAGGSGTVTSVSIVTANGISGSVATATTTPAITLSLGAITPTFVGTTSATEINYVTGVTSGIQSQIDLKSNLYLTHNTQTGTTYTLVLSDKNSAIVEMNNASANTLTVPPNSSVAFPTGTQIPVTQFGAGQTTIVAGSGVTIHTSSGVLTSPGQYAIMVLEKRGTNEWYLWNGVQGITNTAANNELMKSDGTNAVPSGLFMSSTIMSGLTGLNGNVKIAGTSWVATRRLETEENSASSNTVLYPIRLNNITSGTPAAGIGVGIEFYSQTASTNKEIGSTIESIATSVTSTSENFDLVFKTMTSGATATEKLRIVSDGTFNLGSSSVSGSTRAFQVVGSATDIGVTFNLKGAESFSIYDSTNKGLLYTPSTNTLFTNRDANLTISGFGGTSARSLIFDTGLTLSGTGGNLDLRPGSSGSGESSYGSILLNGNKIVVGISGGTGTSASISTDAGTSARNSGRDLNITGGNAYSVSGNGNGGNIIISGGTGHGSGVGGNVGIFKTSPTSKLHITAGSATANTAPLQMDSGAVETTIRSGIFEYNNSFYFSNSALNRIGVPGRIFESFADGGNSSTTETDLHTYTTKANTLLNNGESLEVEYGGSFVSSATATRQIKIYFGGSVILDTGALTLTLSSQWTAYITIMRKNSTTVRYMCSLTTEGAALAAYTSAGELGSLTLSNTNIVKVTGTAAGTGAASNDIVLKIAKGNWEPVSNN